MIVVCSCGKKGESCACRVFCDAARGRRGGRRSGGRGGPGGAGQRAAEPDRRHVHHHRGRLGGVLINYFWANLRSAAPLLLLSSRKAVQQGNLPAGNAVSTGFRWGIHAVAAAM